MKRAQDGKGGRTKLPATVRLGRSGLHGQGLFARDILSKGERIIEYVGERITKAEAERREGRRLARRAAGGDGSVYIFELNQRHDIDGGVPWNPARLINHSCAPNCEVQVIRGQIWIVAFRDLAPGEELTYDYSFDYTEWRDLRAVAGRRSVPATSSARWERPGARPGRTCTMRRA